MRGKGENVMHIRKRREFKMKEQGAKSRMTHPYMKKREKVEEGERKRPLAYPWECDDSQELVITSEMEKFLFVFSSLAGVENSDLILI